MVYSEYAKVKNVLIVDTKYGRRKVCNVTTDRGEEAIWANDLNAFSNIKPGQTINVIRGAKGSLTILENTPTMSEVSNGNGNGNNIQMNRPSSQKEGSHYTYSNNRNHQVNTTPTGVAGSTPNYPVDINDDDISLELPIYGKADSDRVKAFIQQRSKILAYCVECVKRDLGPDAFGEVSLKSLAVSLYIDISKRLD